MKKIHYILGTVAVLLTACSDLVDVDFNTRRQTFAYSTTAGEYVATLDLTGPDEDSATGHIAIYNTANSTDSLWVEDGIMWGSKVRVKFDGKNSFAITGGDNLLDPGELVDITGQAFPEKDSIQITWRYPQGTGDPADDYVVTGHGSLYNGINN